MKYPIGTQTFNILINEGYVYVDKTDLVYQLVTTSRSVFLSRPRRFGKSLLLSTLENYFCGNKKVFRGLAIDSLEREWIEYPVFKIDFNGKEYLQPDALHNTLRSSIANWEDLYGKSEHDTEIGDRFVAVLKKAYEHTGRGCVVLIDEYDKPILDVIDTEMEERNRETLKAFYSNLKVADPYLKFVFLTGVTKFSQVSMFSGFNQPTDISMNPQFDAICGITEDEMDQYFTESIQAMADGNGVTYDEMRTKLKRRYDGYHFSEDMTDIYNPFSLLNAFYNGKVRDYWYATGTPTYLIKLLRHDDVHINEMLEQHYRANDFVDYKADTEKPLPMIYQSGYFTIKQYNERTDKYRLGFPNEEVREGFVTMLSNNYFGERSGADSFIARAVDRLDVGEIEPFMNALKAFLAGIPYDARPSANTEKLTERHFQYTFYLIFSLLSGTGGRAFNEVTQAVGRADCILEYTDYVYVIEFKLDKSADEAMEQIEEKGYALPYLDDTRKVIKIGANFSSKTMNIEEWKIG